MASVALRERVVGRWARKRSWAVAVFAALVSFAFFCEPKTFSGPSYQSVKIVPLALWGAVWAVDAVISVVAALTRRLWAWLAMFFVSMFTASTWIVGLSWERYDNDGHHVSVVSLALWSWFLVTLLFAATERVARDD